MSNLEIINYGLCVICHGPIVFTDATEAEHMRAHLAIHSRGELVEYILKGKGAKRVGYPEGANA